VAKGFDDDGAVPPCTDSPGIFIAAAKTTSFVQKHFLEDDDGIMMMTCPTKVLTDVTGLP
jgi:hypothetical protein